MMERRAYQSLGAILLTFSLSILVGQFSYLRAQNASEDFFDQGEQEFDQEAETLEEPQNSNSQPPLTIDEEPPAATENPQPTEAATESMEERRGQEEQKLEQELNIGEQHPGEPKVEDVPGPNEELGLDGNEPEQPADEEAEVEF